MLQHLEENILQSYTLSLSFVVSYCNIWRKTFYDLASLCFITSHCNIWRKTFFKLVLSLSLSLTDCLFLLSKLVIKADLFHTSVASLGSFSAMCVLYWHCVCVCVHVTQRVCAQALNHVCVFHSALYAQVCLLLSSNAPQASESTI